MISMSQLMSPISSLPQHAARASGLWLGIVSTLWKHDTITVVRRSQAKPAAERSGKGEASSLAEPCTDRAA